MAGVADLTGDLGKALWEPAWQKMSLVLGCPLSPGTAPCLCLGGGWQWAVVPMLEAKC